MHHNRGAPIWIFEADWRSQKAVFVDPIPIFLKPSFYHVELFIVILQSVFLDIHLDIQNLNFIFENSGNSPHR